MGTAWQLGVDQKVLGPWDDHWLENHQGNDMSTTKWERLPMVTCGPGILINHQVASLKADRQRKRLKLKRTSWVFWGDRSFFGSASFGAHVGAHVYKGVGVLPLAMSYQSPGSPIRQKESWRIWRIDLDPVTWEPDVRTPPKRLLLLIPRQLKTY